MNDGFPAVMIRRLPKPSFLVQIKPRFLKLLRLYRRETVCFFFVILSGAKNL